ncbi:hypothetical protein PAEPH01_2662, partial [Pancytospora epiphaga]
LSGLLKICLNLIFPLPSILSLAKYFKGGRIGNIMSIAKYLSIMFSLNFWNEYFYNGTYDYLVGDEVRKIIAEAPSEQKKAYTCAFDPKVVFPIDISNFYKENEIRSCFFGITFENWVHLCFAFGPSLIFLILSIFLINFKYSPSLRLNHSQ